MTALHFEAVATSADDTLLTGRVSLCRDSAATLNDVKDLLSLAGRLLPQGQLDPVRATDVLHVAVEALGRFDAPTRCAPPSALTDAVAEFGTACGAGDCSEQVFPWQDDSSYCSDECRRRGAE